MDIPHTGTTSKAPHYETPSLLLQKLGQGPVSAKVLEVIRLNASDIRYLTEQKVLSPAQLNHMNKAPVLLAKLQLPHVPNTAIWAFSERVVNKNTWITVAGKGNAVVVLSNAQATATLTSSALQGSPSPSQMTTDTLLHRPTSPSARTTDALPSIAPVVDTPLTTSRPKLDSLSMALLKDITRLTMPKQDKDLVFLSGLKPELSTARTELLRLASSDPKSLYSRTADLVRQLDNWHRQLPEFPKLTAGAIRRALSSSGVFAESQQTRPEAPSIPHSNTRTGMFEASSNTVATRLQSVDDTKSLLITALLLIKSLASALDGRTAISNRGAIESILQLLFTHRHGDPARRPRIDDARQAAKTLEQLVSTSLARIIFNQSNSLQNSQATETPGTQVFSTDLLLRHNDQTVPVHISVREQAEKKSNSDTKRQKKQKNWRVFLEWQFEQFGRYHSDIKVGGDEVSARFWIENDEIKQRFIDNISILRENLENNGVAVAQLSVESTPLDTQHKPRTAPLIDVST